MLLLISLRFTVRKKKKKGKKSLCAHRTLPQPRLSIYERVFVHCRNVTIQHENLKFGTYPTREPQILSQSQALWAFYVHTPLSSQYSEISIRLRGRSEVGLCATCTPSCICFYFLCISCSSFVPSFLLQQGIAGSWYAYSWRLCNVLAPKLNNFFTTSNYEYLLQYIHLSLG